jgi:hypothetical protein
MAVVSIYVVPLLSRPRKLFSTPQAAGATILAAVSLSQVPTGVAVSAEVENGPFIPSVPPLLGGISHARARKGRGDEKGKSPPE